MNFPRHVLIAERGPVCSEIISVVVAFDAKYQVVSSADDLSEALRAGTFDLVYWGAHFLTTDPFLLLDLRRQAVVFGVSSVEEGEGLLIRGAHHFWLRGHDSLRGSLREGFRLWHVEQEVREIEAVLRETDERLQKATRNEEGFFGEAARMVSLGELAAGVVHEINNPLTYVLFNAAYLNRELPVLLGALESVWNQRDEITCKRGLETVWFDAGLDTDTSGLTALIDCVHEIAVGANRIRDITWDLKSFSSLDHHNIAPIDLNKAIESALKVVEKELKYRAEVVLELSDSPAVMANEARIIQVFVNILLNASQAFEDQHFSENRLTIRSFFEGEQVVVGVVDTGCGILAADLIKLKTPFFSTKRGDKKGTGLGLSIANTIVDECSGSLDIQSVFGEGTTVTLSFPTVSPSQASSLASLDSVTCSVPRILVVDEDPIFLAAVERMAGASFEIQLCTTGAEVVDLLQTGVKYELFLCDLMMPGMSGMDLYEWLRGHRPDLVRRTVFMTGGAFSSTASRFLYEIQNPVVEKPFHAETFSRQLFDLIQRAAVHEGASSFGQDA